MYKQLGNESRRLAVFFFIPVGRVRRKGNYPEGESKTKSLYQ